MEARLIALAEHLQAERIMGLCTDAGCVTRVVGSVCLLWFSWSVGTLFIA